METETDGLTRIAIDYGPLIDQCCTTANSALPASVLAGLIWRESRGGAALTPPDPSGTGDGGHGRGLCQIDDRSWPAFCATDDWKDPEKNILFAIGILNSVWRGFSRKLTLPESEQQRFTLASYNAGTGNVKKAMALGEDMDTPTAHGNYGMDVLRLAALYADIWNGMHKTVDPGDVSGFGSNPASI